MEGRGSSKVDELIHFSHLIPESHHSSSLRSRPSAPSDRHQAPRSTREATLGTQEALVPSAIDEFNSEGVTDMKLTVRGPRLTLKMSDRFPPLHIAAHHCTQLVAASKRARSTDNSLRHCLTES
jgi:hypothetical protein